MIYQSSIGIKNYQNVIIFCLHQNVFSPPRKRGGGGGGGGRVGHDAKDICLLN